MAELAIGTGAPGISVATSIDVGAMIFTTSEVLNFLEERLNSGRMPKNDGIKSGDA